MVEKYRGGIVPAMGESTGLEQTILDNAKTLAKRVEEAMDTPNVTQALQEIWTILADCNRFIDFAAPWNLAKSEEDASKLDTVLYVLIESIRIVAVLLQPFMTQIPAKIFEQIGVSHGTQTTWESAYTFGALEKGTKVVKGQALFPRLDIQKELEALKS